MGRHGRRARVDGIDVVLPVRFAACANGERHPRQCPIREQERAPDPFPHRHEPAEHSRPPPAASGRGCEIRGDIGAIARAISAESPHGGVQQLSGLQAGGAVDLDTGGQCVQQGEISHGELGIARRHDDGLPAPARQIRDVLQGALHTDAADGREVIRHDQDAAAQRTSSGFAATAGPYTRRSGRHRG